MSKKQLSTDAALARQDLIQSHRYINDTIRDLWVSYVDPAGNKALSPNSYMTLRKHWNRLFGISSIKELVGDIERCLLYALAYLAANMDGFKEVIDHEHELRQWRALADMMRQGAAAIDYFVGDAKPALTLIHGGQ